ncbi:hypothetical protein L3Q82_025607 [Scortum barcoo]|uniref:Uncharacterized protein n=1 Tax=Scortum barcoo TaxID=214431 RepID=A0ACB8WMS1_9TELE|nr:hypothetical protein L3Q82_025607 [Scortum barcoo]
MSHWEEAWEDPGHAGETVSWLPWKRLGVPSEELEEVSGVREVWASLLRLLPPHDPGFACVNKRVRYSRTELIKIRDGSATSTTLQSAVLGLRALLGRLQLLRTPDWRSGARRTEGKRKRCARKQKRGKRGGLLARLKANAGKPPIPSLFLSNVRSLDNKLDLLR